VKKVLRALVGAVAVVILVAAGLISPGALNSAHSQAGAAVGPCGPAGSVQINGTYTVTAGIGIGYVGTWSANWIQNSSGVITSGDLQAVTPLTDDGIDGVITADVSGGTCQKLPTVDGNWTSQISSVTLTSTGTWTVSESGTYVFNDGAPADDNSGSFTAAGTLTPTATPTVKVTDNSSTVSPGGRLTFTASVTGSGATPTGTMTWQVSDPKGNSVSCSSTTGPTGSSNVATYTCNIADVVAGSYSATASYPGDSYYTSSSATDTALIASQVTVTFPPIQNLDTPDGMNDRIPPRVNTPITVTVAGLSAGNSVTFSIANQGPDNGEANIDGGDTAVVSKNGPSTLVLTGTTQTGYDVDSICESPGPQLTVQADMNGASVAASAPFAVSAIPIGVSEKFDGALHTDKFQGVSAPSLGFLVAISWISDSGNPADLDCDFGYELLSGAPSTGTQQGTAIQMTDRQFDHLTIPLADVTATTKSAALTIQQTHGFTDMRSSPNIDSCMAHSGYDLDRSVKVIPWGKLPIPPVITLQTTLLPTGATGTGTSLTTGASVNCTSIGGKVVPYSEPHGLQPASGINLLQLAQL
jgi:hypothetical protein